MMLKPCPFCGSEVTIDFRPLWRGSHGYHGCYEIFIKCDKCGCSNYGTISNTIQLTKEEAKKKVVEAWNRRAEGGADE